jgi:transcription elongation factor GreA
MADMFFTRDGLEKLKEELKSMKGRKRRQIALALEKARLLGDLSENAEYESAKMDQAVNEKRINELTDKLLHARVLEDENISSDKVYIGAKVKLFDIENKEDIEYMLVAEDEADFASGKISISSPVGRALLGKEKDEIVNIKIPAGVLKYKVVEISR